MSAVVNGNVLDLQLLLDASYSMVGECKGLTHPARLLLDLWQARRNSSSCRGVLSREI